MKSIEKALDKIASSLNSIVIKLAEITPQDIEMWKSRIHTEILAPFESISSKLESMVKGIMTEMEQVDDEIVKKLEELKFISGKVEVGNMAASSYQRKAKEVFKLKAKFNELHYKLIFLTSGVSYIKHEIGTPGDSMKSIIGDSGFLDRVGRNISKVKRAIKAVMKPAKQGGIELKKILADAKIRFQDPFWAMRSVSNNVTEYSQPGALPPGVMTINIDDFKKSPAYEKLIQAEIANIKKKYPELTDEQIKERLSDENTGITYDVEYIINELNSKDNTWRKGREIYEFLDPPASQQGSTIGLAGTIKSTIDSGFISGADKPKNWKQISKKQPYDLKPEDVLVDAYSDRELRKSNARAMTLDRCLSELMNPDAHWTTLFAGSQLQDIESGKTRGERFLDSLREAGAEHLTRDPKVLKRAAEIDKEDLEGRKALALAVLTNPNTPDWLLMRMATVGHRQSQEISQLKGENAEEEREIKDLLQRDVVKAIRKVSTEMLKQRGYNFKVDDTGRKVREEDGSGYKGSYVFEKSDNNEVQSSDRSGLRKTSGNPQIDSIDRQIQSENDQINQLEQQINSHRDRIETLQDNKQTLQEQDARVQESAQNMMADTSQPPASPTTQASYRKYKVIYNKK